MAVETEIKVPDIGGATDVDVIEILVKEGDIITKDTPLVTLETDKASMELPSPAAGVVKSIKMKLGDKVSEGDVVLVISAEGTDSAPATEVKKESSELSHSVREDVSVTQKDASVTQKDAGSAREEINSAPVDSAPVDVTSNAHLISAGPAVRRMAHALGVNLSEVQGTERKSRITKGDVELFVKNKLKEKTSGNGFALPSAPVVDFSKFGPIDIKPLSKIKRLTGVNVHRAWVTIPHVTQFDEADITDLEAFRKSEITTDYKLTILAFVCKVVSKALTVFPQFNSSLDASGENLIYKQYCNIGIAVETPNGLVVPVIKNVDCLSVADIAREMARLSSKARDKGLMPADMSGGCFTISSLGGIGGTAFTPIVNGPEVAILGLSRASMKPVYDNGGFIPRLMLPLSLSYDHRVIDGAEAARFARFISDGLTDIRRILL